MAAVASIGALQSVLLSASMQAKDEDGMEESAEWAARVRADPWAPQLALFEVHTRPVAPLTISSDSEDDCDDDDDAFGCM